VAESLAEPIGNWCGGDGVECGGARGGEMVVPALLSEGEDEGDGMEGERGRPGLHSERARDVESFGRACTPRGGFSLCAVGHPTSGRSLNSMASASIDRLTAKVQPIIVLNLARVNDRC
jgi:hypothetical protein